jgi:hypothetical protein
MNDKIPILRLGPVAVKQQVCFSAGKSSQCLFPISLSNLQHIQYMILSSKRRILVFGLSVNVYSTRSHSFCKAQNCARLLGSIKFQYDGLLAPLIG